MEQQIEEAATPLETPFGYSAFATKGTASTIEDVYHLDSVWPFEQALIDMGAERHGLMHMREVCMRVSLSLPLSLSLSLLWYMLCVRLLLLLLLSCRCYEPTAHLCLGMHR